MIDFSMFETVDVGGAQNKLKGLVRNYNNHFICLLEISKPSNIAAGILEWLFFAIYELC